MKLSFWLAVTLTNIPESMQLLWCSASDDHWQALISHPNPREMVLTSKEKDDTLFRSFTYEFSTMEVGPRVALKLLGFCCYMCNYMTVVNGLDHLLH